MKLKEIISTIEKRLPKQQAEDFDNVGLLCGNPEREITGMLVCHDALEIVVDEAIHQNLNLIVCFHPIIFSGLKSLTGKNYVEKAVLKAIENKIAIYAIHTTWDNDYLGVNHGICQALGLKNTKILMPKTSFLEQMIVYVPQEFAQKVQESVFAAGAGNIGFYDECSFSVSGQGSFRPMEGSSPFSGVHGKRTVADEVALSVIYEKFKRNRILHAAKTAHPYEEVAYQIYALENENQYLGLGRYGEFVEAMEEEDFLNLLKNCFQLKVIRHSSLLNKKIKTVGVLGGSGASGIKTALALQCDAYVTGDVKYHDFFSAEEKMLICDIGHFESERFVVQQLFEILSEKFPNFAILKTKENTNPVNYFL
ncbi:MAG: Nif3-like dinuclear metal center hexameric protein [Bacteroidetes bacterium]|nr:Nif3-like dinuclear metal center hexameric protein [Bacteroidota bacterium]